MTSNRFFTSFRRALRRKKAVKKEKQLIFMSITTDIQIPLHGAHVGAPKFIPIAFEPHIIHSRLNHNARLRG